MTLTTKAATGSFFYDTWRRRKRKIFRGVTALREIGFLLEKLSGFDGSARLVEKGLQEKMARADAKFIIDSHLEFLTNSCADFEESCGNAEALKRSVAQFHKRLEETIIMDAPFVRHGYAKPFGYPGDHVAIEMIYKNQPVKNGAAGMIEKSLLEAPAPEAVRNRKDLLLRIIKEELERKENVSILNLACGPAREIAELANDERYAGRFKAVNIDADERALGYAKGLLNGPSSGGISFVLDNAFEIARRKSNAERYGRQDIVICSGLFDYLNDKWAVRLLGALHGLLKEGGLMVIGNFGLENPSRVPMEWFMDWYLIHRSEAEMKELFDRAGIKDVQVIKEPLGINLFGVVRR